MFPSPRSSTFPPRRSEDFSPPTVEEEFGVHVSPSLRNDSSSSRDFSQIGRDLRRNRRRVDRACTRCRVRKTKCDGKKPCTRCIESDDLCEYSRDSRKESKGYSPDYVEQILDENEKYKIAIRMLYTKNLLLDRSNDFSAKSKSGEIPLVHAILEDLGLLESTDGLSANDMESWGEGLSRGSPVSEDLLSSKSFSKRRSLEFSSNAYQPSSAYPPGVNLGIHGHFGSAPNPVLPEIDSSPTFAAPSNLGSTTTTESNTHLQTYPFNFPQPVEGFDWDPIETRPQSEMLSDFQMDQEADAANQMRFDF